MIKLQKLEDLIKEKIPSAFPDSRGFYSHRCQVCNDYKVRAGFKFDNGTIGFNCWNCGSTGRYEEFSGKISGKMRRILNAYGIDDSEISSIVNSGFFKKPSENDKITLSSISKVNTATPPVKLPPKSIKLGGTEEFLDYQEKIIEYLLKRCVDLTKYSFFFSLEPRFKDSVIIPFYRNGSLIFWQSRSIIDGNKKRYDNAPGSRDAVMFNFDQLNYYSKAPLFVTEGVFDAMMFDGLAILGSKLSSAKIELLKKTSRRLVFVIDKDANGAALAEQVLSHGWEITFAPDGAEDVNKSVQRFGKAWTAMELLHSIPTNEAKAKLAISMRCK